jgi:hypothetical protein
MTDVFLAVKNWDRFQTPVKPEERSRYIALHTVLLDDDDICHLPDDLQLMLIRMWLLRGRLGRNIPYDHEYLRSKIHHYDPANLQWLIEEGYLEATEVKHPPVRKSRSTKSKNYSAEYAEEFEQWWLAYPSGPNKTGKVNAFKAWQQVAAVRPPHHELMSKTQAYAAKFERNPAERKFVKGPAAWLRDRRWEDDGLSPAKKIDNINRTLDREQVDHFADPLWKSYVEAVVSGEAKPGFKEYANAHK